MLIIDQQIENEGLLTAARQICMAARTAPKGKGKDLLVTAIITGEEKDRVSQQMKKIGEEKEIPFFLRDAANVDAVEVMVLLGSRKEPLGIPNCGFCGYEDCAAMFQAGACCSFNVGDLGIAVGSAVSIAADMRIDNRIMFSAGKAVIDLGLLGEDVHIAYGIPLSVTGKSPFFDRG
ncbi:Uncharacterized protein, contains ferredoxin domain [Malonomonas rubra DSM 5091]|uniref:Uncharacterized protein, contains ferredoxin domain n=2 Tax=Malonomonas rubra TaxID=57040 RepID=A0A1M6B641_MALRU|nr:Uncharacterized protein, contains ferredoxin domain [Malonomonas rubra DSM 5091]